MQSLVCLLAGRTSAISERGARRARICWVGVQGKVCIIRRGVAAGQGGTKEEYIKGMA